MRKEAEEWLKIAIEDLQAAEFLIEKSLYRMVCYHAQQAVEKFLKALLCEQEIDFARTHNILDLRNAVNRIGCKSRLTAKESTFLNSIYRSRYPSDLGILPSGEPTREDARKALRLANIMSTWIKGIETGGVSDV